MQVVELSEVGQAVDLPRGGAASLGVFDGVHLGHRRILTRMMERASEIGGVSIVLTFAVHPVAVLRGLPARMITSLPHRLKLFEQLGISRCVVLPFDERVRQIEAGDFARTVFVETLGLRWLVLGPDARIGFQAQGDVRFLAGFCEQNDIRLEVVEDLHVDDVRVSSTRIRAAIADGDLVRARRMLGRDWSMLGIVMQGEGRGRKLGYRTANLNLHHEIRPPPGVYAGWARLEQDRHPCVINIGIRPTFGPDGDLTVEAHLLEFDGDLYDSELELILVQRVRSEQRFPSREELTLQIGRDIAEARRILARPEEEEEKPTP